MKTTVRILAVASALLCAMTLFQACQMLGAPVPQSFSERVAVAYASVTGVRQTAASLVRADMISPDDAQNIQNQADTARQGIDVARRLHEQGASVAAEDRLAAMVVILQELNSYLADRQPRGDR